MANNYCDTTGSLKVEKLTDMLKMLFGHFMNDLKVQNGYLYISTSDSLFWETVFAGVVESAKELGIESDPEDASAAFVALGKHFGKETEAAEFFGITNPDESVEIAELAWLAKNVFDDGHGLTVVSIESAMTCSKLRHGEFGGYGEYAGEFVNVCSSSDSADRVGSQLDAAIKNQDYGKAASVCLFAAQTLLAGIYDPAVFDKVKSEMKTLCTQI